MLTLAILGPGATLACSSGASPSDSTLTSEQQPLARAPRYDDLPDLPGFGISPQKWASSEIFYFFENGTADMSGTTEQNAVTNALLLWSLETPLTFTPGSSSANSNISFKWATGEHGDGAANAFDGQDGILAHAQYPGNAASDGDVHFDDAETWADAIRGNDSQPIDLVSVAAHEVGHALGLTHSDVLTALMTPNYTQSHRYLSYDDVIGIQQLYGSAQPIAIRDMGSSAEPTAFVRASDNHLWEAAWNGSSWQWFDHGGDLRSSPATVDFNGSSRVYMRWSDGDLRERYWDGFQWQWQDHLGPTMIGMPTAISWGGNKISIFVRTVSNTLQERQWNGSSWLAWINHGGDVLTTPSVALDPSGKPTVFVLKQDRSLAQRWFDGSNYVWVQHGGLLTSAPNAVSSGTDVRVFARGEDGALWERYYTTQWNWSSHGGTIRGVPSAATTRSIFVRGTDNALWQNWWNGSQWVWTNHGGSCTASPTATTAGGTSRVYVRASDATLQQRRFLSGNWGWVNEGGVLP